MSMTAGPTAGRLFLRHVDAHTAVAAPKCMHVHTLCHAFQPGLGFHACCRGPGARRLRLRGCASGERRRAGAVSAVASMLPNMFGAGDGGLQCRGCDDFAARKPSASVVALILEAKIAQATLLAWRAYEPLLAFRELTGLHNARLLTHEQLDTQVRPHAPP